MKISLNLKDLSTQSHVHPPFQPSPPITVSLPTPNLITSKLPQTGLDAIKNERFFVEKAHKLRESLETSILIRQGCAEVTKVPSKSMSQIMDLQDTASKSRQRQYGEKPPTSKPKTAFNHV